MSDQHRPPKSTERPITAIDTYVKKIRIWAVQNGYTPHSLAQEANLSVGTLRYMYRTAWNPTLETLRAIELTMIRIEARRQLDAAAATPQTPPHESDRGQP